MTFEREKYRLDGDYEVQEFQGECTNCKGVGQIVPMIDENLYRRCLESVAPAENKRLRRTSTNFATPIPAGSRGQMGAQPPRKVHFDPQEHNDFGERK